jgi:hypothetical protein
VYCVVCLQEYGQLIDAALEYYEAVGGEDAAELSLRPDDAPVNMYEDINPELIGGEAQVKLVITLSSVAGMAVLNQPC